MPVVQVTDDDCTIEDMKLNFFAIGYHSSTGTILHEKEKRPVIILLNTKIGTIIKYHYLLQTSAAHLWSSKKEKKKILRTQSPIACKF